MSKKIKVFIFSTFAFAALFVFSANSFAQGRFYDDEGDEYIDDDDEDIYDDGSDFVYQQNGPGDQYLNIRIMPNFPLNFDKKIKIGGQITVGYGRFITSWLAVGAEVAFGYNPTIGNNMYTYIPITANATFLPAIKKFEIPITFNIGIAIENYLSNTFFPAFIMRGGAGLYYRINENWSAGIEGFFTYMPQTYVKKDKRKYNDYLNILSVSAGMKYHF